MNCLLEWVYLVYEISLFFEVKFVKQLLGITEATLISFQLMQNLSDRSFCDYIFFLNWISPDV